MSNARKLADNLPTEGQLANRNMIINGQMTIAQRNTAAHNEGSGYFSLDRWAQEKVNQDQFTYSVEQVSDSPSGFSKSLKVTTSTAETALASDEHAMIYQIIEGNNLERVGFGTAAAKPLTLSFYVKSSITGNFSSALYISDANKIYSQAYTISSANTWEYKTLTFPALTSGAPNIDNTAGAFLYFGLFAGSGKNTATTDWTTYNVANILGGQTANLGGTLNATWQITGCQLEVGSQSTPFEHESVGVTLEKCQRYLQMLIRHTENDDQQIGSYYNSSRAFICVPHKVSMRATPTISLVGSVAGVLYSNNGGITTTTLANTYARKDSCGLDFTPSSSGGSGNAFHFDWTQTSSAHYIKAEAEL